MKRILIALMVASAFCSTGLAQQKATLQKESTSKGEITVSSADTAYAAEYTDTPDDSTYVSDSQYDEQSHQNNHMDALLNNLPDTAINGGIAILTITLGILFAFPLFIIFIAFYFRYKNRKARYQLVEQAIAAGQPIPEGLFKESLTNDTRTKGIKNICLGIGLFIFIWALTDSFGLGSIGLLIMFTGIGQWLVSRNQTPTDEQK